MKSVTFGRLLTQNKDVVYSLAYSLLRNREDSEDIVQETFMRLWNNMERIETETVRAWLLRVARNRAIDLLRKRKYVSDADPEVLLDMGANKPPEDLSATSSRKQRKKLQIKQLEEALERLPENQRTAVLLRELHGLKYEEVASSMDMPVGTVKVAVFRAKKALRKVMLREASADRGRLIDELLTG